MALRVSQNEFSRIATGRLPLLLSVVDVEQMLTALDVDKPRMCELLAPAWWPTPNTRTSDRPCGGEGTTGSESWPAWSGTLPRSGAEVVSGLAEVEVPFPV